MKSSKIEYQDFLYLGVAKESYIKVSRKHLDIFFSRNKKIVWTLSNRGQATFEDLKFIAKLIVKLSDNLTELEKLDNSILDCIPRNLKDLYYIEQ